jgi:hypothetical protein
MVTSPDRDCAHLRCDYTPTIIDNVIVGSKITNWCCDLNGDQSCGTLDCPTDRKYGNMPGNRDYWWNQGQYA